MPSLEGKSAIITGAASGIGAATATRFVAEGAAVVLADVSDDAGEARAAELGDAATYIHCDVANPAEIAHLIEAAVAFFNARGGRLDVLFNNAGIGVLSEVPDLDPEAWHRVIDVDLNAVYYACRLAIPLMREQGGGSIINTASISGLFGDYGFSAYSAAKGAVINLTRSMAVDHGKDGIRINALCPGYIKTGITDRIQATPELDAGFAEVALGRAGQPEEMAAVVAFLASDDASYVTGAAIVADGGRTAHSGQPNTPAIVRAASG